MTSRRAFLIGTAAASVAAACPALADDTRVRCTAHWLPSNMVPKHMWYSKVEFGSSKPTEFSDKDFITVYPDEPECVNHGAVTKVRRC